MESNFFERIMQLAKSQGYKNITDFARNGLGYASPEKLNRLKDGNKKPSVDVLIDISNKFEFINLRWLITGRGKTDIRDGPGTTNEDAPRNSKQDDQVVIKLQQDIIALMKEVSDLKDQLLVTKEPTVQSTRAKSAG